MGYDLLLFMSCLLIPVLMLVFGLIAWKHPPRTANSLYGYRTSRSMKSQEAWDFAQRYFGRLWFLMSLILLPVSAVITALLAARGEVALTVGSLVLLTVQLIPLISVVIPTERALRTHFDQDGRPIGSGNPD